MWLWWEIDCSSEVRGEMSQNGNQHERWLNVVKTMMTDAFHALRVIYTNKKRKKQTNNNNNVIKVNIVIKVDNAGFNHRIQSIDWFLTLHYISVPRDTIQCDVTHDIIPYVNITWYALKGNIEVLGFCEIYREICLLGDFNEQEGSAWITRAQALPLITSSWLALRGMIKEHKRREAAGGNAWARWPLGVERDPSVDTWGGTTRDRMRERCGYITAEVSKVTGLKF